MALRRAAAGDLRQLAETLAATADETIFGVTAFVVRDLVPGIAAKAVPAALADRGKKSRRRQHHLPRGGQAPVQFPRA